MTQLDRRGVIVGQTWRHSRGNVATLLARPGDTAGHIW